MKQLLLCLSLFLIKIVIAQNSPTVQFQFTANKVGDTIVHLKINATIEKGLEIFSTKSLSNNAPFISTFQLDSSLNISRHFSDTIIEKGSPIIENIEGINYHLFKDSLEILLPLHISSGSRIKGSISWLGKKGSEFPSGTQAFNVTINQSLNNYNLLNSNKKATTFDWSLFIICFLTGLAAVLTPCVFPLVPVTVSFFLKRSKTKKRAVRNAWIYALSIILIYLIPTIILTLVFGDKLLYQVSTHPVSNILFFLIFIIFSISFLSGFDLTLPGSWASKTDTIAGKGGLTGIFFMALTLVIVSFSCTGPIVASLLSQTSGQGISIGPIIGMLGFGCGLAIPFGIFALSPSLMHFLPKSGGWLNSIKVFFGFIELALAMKFLSNVDLAYHWHLLNRDVFLCIWIAISALLGLYLLGKIKFHHDSELKYIPVPRFFVALISFSFALYLLPGLWGAPLKPLSGILPPHNTQDFDLDKLQYNLNSDRTALVKQPVPEPKKYIDKFHVPFGLKAYFDVNEALQAAKALRKPIMIDFTGWSCANCRKMENEVWSNPEVFKKIREDFILVSLYVDDKTELPQEEQITKANGEAITTIGDKNLDYEQTVFNLNAQPLYKFLDIAGNSLSDIQYGYDPDISKFLQHLQTVETEFKKRYP